MAAYDACPPRSIWTTQDGRKIPVSWMQSQHLCHTFNMMMRKNGLRRADVELLIRGSYPLDALPHMFSELQARGLLTWMDDNQISVRTLRETLAQLCMLRAIIDCGNLYGLAFMNDPQPMLEWILDKPGGHEDIITKFTEYRLGYPG